MYSSGSPAWTASCAECGFDLEDGESRTLCHSYRTGGRAVLHFAYFKRQQGPDQSFSTLRGRIYHSTEEMAAAVEETNEKYR